MIQSLCQKKGACKTKQRNADNSSKTVTSFMNDNQTQTDDFRRLESIIFALVNSIPSSHSSNIKEMSILWEGSKTAAVRSKMAQAKKQ